jgi:hypothetical protein
MRTGAKERDCAVDAAAHRDRDSLGMARGAKDRADRVRKRVDDERFSADRRCLEQSQACQRPVEPIRVGANDSITLHCEADEGPVAVARSVSYDFDHGVRLAD